MKKSRKPLIIVLSCLAVLALAALGVWFFWLKNYLAARTASPVYVTPVTSITGLNTGATPRFSGIVEPQQIYKINKDESQTVAEILVKEGDEVHIGDVLFTYDTEDIQLALQQAQIDLEGITNQITTLNAQLATLNAEKKKAPKDEQISYTVQIQSVELQIKTQEYESTLKQAEIDKLEASLTHTDVLSEVDGVVKEINPSPTTDYNGNTTGFINILSSGEFRIKGTISELNQGSIYEGQDVIVRSRLDSEISWEGTVDSIDMEPAQNNNNNMYFYGMDSGEQSSKYNFYVTLNDPEGLILGQHVYIEPNMGSSGKKEGLWLPSVYVAHDETGSFVWAKDSEGWLEKRPVMLGEYDKDNDMYQIKNGVTTADALAYPSDTLMPGMPTQLDNSYQPGYGANGGMNGGMGEDFLPPEGEVVGGAGGAGDFDDFGEPDEEPPAPPEPEDDSPSESQSAAEDVVG